MSAEDIEIKLHTTTDEQKIHIVIHESENIQEDDAGLQCEVKVKRIEANEVVSCMKEDQNQGARQNCSNSHTLR